MIKSLLLLLECKMYEQSMEEQFGDPHGWLDTVVEDMAYKFSPDSLSQAVLCQRMNTHACSDARMPDQHSSWSLQMQINASMHIPRSCRPFVFQEV